MAVNEIELVEMVVKQDKNSCITPKGKYINGMDGCDSKYGIGFIITWFQRLGSICIVCNKSILL